MTMDDGLCECCNKKKEILVGVASIPFVPISIAWCSECLQSGAIPYWACVANTAACGGLEPTNEEWQGLVELSLKYHNKSLKDFNDDVNKAIKELEEHGH